MSVPTAVAMVHASGTGTTLQLIGTPAAQRDLALPARMIDSVLATITGDARDASTTAAWASGLLGALDDLDAVLSPGERALASELLRRVADAR